MRTYTFHTKSKRVLADTVTPVSIYLKLRDQYPNSILLESSDYHDKEDSFSYICCHPIAEFKVDDYTIEQSFPDSSMTSVQVSDVHAVPEALKKFIKRFRYADEKHKFLTHGIFGYSSYNATQYFEDICFKKRVNKKDIPDMLYRVYQYVIVINHFNNELFIFDHRYDETKTDKVDYFETLINQKNFASFDFNIQGKETSNFTDASYMEMVQKGIEHNLRGDVFQIVLSRRFEQAFQGDEFNVYRALRSINPSPYLFYFDYGNYKIFGSSPEAQIVVQNNKATINPIAGTFRRSGDDVHDMELAKHLKADPKENAEHVMLVDLARNDLSRHGKCVEVHKYREVQFFSHVIHLVSEVTAQVHSYDTSMRIMADTFPAGTLSGAPKYRAMELIDQYEPDNREIYGGAIGYIGFDGTINHAIIIRSFLSKENRLFFQAGAGVVAKSNVEKEKNEVNNKLMALRKAIKMAEHI